MNSKDIRKTFLDFFESKKHKIVKSAPVVLKNDPTLMFTNAGMNQFKDYFLGNSEPDNPRISDTQKCLRVSGKHNDLEEVGIDSYHHTLFEMLGNWSIGDYFKKEAIGWAYELLVDVYGLDKERLYVSVFEGDKKDNLEPDTEAADMWKNYFPEDRILYFDRKDNFWEMGNVGPCGPCSEIHIDLRSDEERAKIPGKDLVNADDPLVVEIWNLVFIQFNRKADGSLEELPAKHIDTGMGFERLCMALQNKTSNYDTDVFIPLIQKIENISGKKYTYSYDLDAKKDIAMRVAADHIRAVAFAIADGELPSNTGAGYVIRRILRRAVRYYYSFLEVDKPMLHLLIPTLAAQFQDVFHELAAQKDFVTKVILEEEKSFLRTLEAGLKRMDNLDVKDNVVDGKTAFELYDTYGFPIDLIRLISSERNWKVDESAFEKALQEQKDRSRADAKKMIGDWNVVNELSEVQFVGYDQNELLDAKIMRYRIVTIKDKPQYQVVLDKTPFYAEGGGQVGDTGTLLVNNETIHVVNTVKENELIIHIVNKLPENMEGVVHASINTKKRILTENNHSSTHLLHAALKEILGEHVNQKGSLVNDRYLRFDFSHFSKVTDEELAQIEQIVNRRIRENIQLSEARDIPIDEAKEAGAMMLFGEKYGDHVRMITFNPSFSVELCGGCHVDRTGRIGYFKITSESAIASGVRRIEAVTAGEAEKYLNAQLEELKDIKGLFKNPTNTAKNIYLLQEETKSLRKKLDDMMVQQAANLKTDLIKEMETHNGVNIIRKELSINDQPAIKTLSANLLKEINSGIIAFGFAKDGKAQLMISISEDLTSTYQAGTLIREIAKNIKGGGGGQAFFATAGGKDPNGIAAALDQIVTLL